MDRGMFRGPKCDVACEGFCRLPARFGNGRLPRALHTGALSAPSTEPQAAARCHHAGAAGAEFAAVRGAGAGRSHKRRRSWLAGHPRGAGSARSMAGRPWGAPGGTSKGNCSALLNASQPAPGGGEGARTRPSWLVSALALILIFTIVVDVLGNLLVILSVYRNKKLRNAGRGSRDLAAWTGSLQLAPTEASPFPATFAARSPSKLPVGWLFLRKVQLFFLNTGSFESFLKIEIKALWFTFP